MELIYNDKKLNAEIAKGPNGYRLIADGEELDLDIGRLESGAYSILIKGKTVKAYVGSDKESVFVQINGSVFEFHIPKEDSERRSDMDSASGDEAYAILPPMPSKVVKVLVNVGDKVSVGDGLIILESMKMENLVKSKVDAVVKEINFSDGDLVDTGKVIIQLEKPNGDNKG